MTKPVDQKLKDVEPGSDADETPLAPIGETPADPNKEKPVAPVLNDEKQLDDNVDDHGNKAGGGTIDQPV